MPLNSAKAEGILSQQSVRRPTTKRARRTAISPGANSDEGQRCIPFSLCCSTKQVISGGRAKSGGSRLACGKFREAERLRSEAEADRPQSPLLAPAGAKSCCCKAPSQKQLPRGSGPRGSYFWHLLRKLAVYNGKQPCLSDAAKKEKPRGLGPRGFSFLRHV